MLLFWSGVLLAQSPNHGTGTDVGSRSEDEIRSHGRTYFQSLDKALKALKSISGGSTGVAQRLDVATEKFHTGKYSYCVSGRTSVGAPGFDILRKKSCKEAAEELRRGMQEDSNLRAVYEPFVELQKAATKELQWIGRRPENTESRGDLRLQLKISMLQVFHRATNEIVQYQSAHWGSELGARMMPALTDHPVSGGMHGLAAYIYLRTARVGLSEAVQARFKGEARNLAIAEVYFLEGIWKTLETNVINGELDRMIREVEMAIGNLQINSFGPGTSIVPR